LKNQNDLLPIDKDKINKIAILGPNADKEMAEGGGSSAVKPPYEITPMKGIIEECGGKVEISDSVSDADYIFLVVGLNHEQGNDCENADRTSIELPLEQIELINDTVEKNSNTIVILINGGPISMESWVESTPAIIEAWYPGMEGGRALADIIFGNCTPSGKLPITFPKRLSDSPAHKSEKTYPGNEKVLYDEDILVGYRYFDTREIEPLFPFGHGLSYTTFDYENLRLDKKEMGKTDRLNVQLDISNSGTREGAEVVQLYIKDKESKVLRPEKELKRFEKVRLDPNETKTIEFEIKKDDLAFFDENLGNWTVEEGIFKILVGSSSRDIRLKKSFKYGK
jgi:beta-glucosidase